MERTRFTSNWNFGQEILWSVKTHLFVQVFKDGDPFGLRQTYSNENSFVALLFQALKRKKKKIWIK